MKWQERNRSSEKNQIHHGGTEHTEKKEIRMGILKHQALTEQIIRAAIEVHKELGPGLMESAYEECLCYELSICDIEFQRQVPLPVHYKKVKLDCGYRLDILVEDKVILELKAVEDILPIHEAQLITYLKLSNKSVGLLINFNVPVLKDGITQRVN
jgi:GxxExxY protein